MTTRSSKRATQLTLIAVAIVAGFVLWRIYSEMALARQMSAENAALNQVIEQLTNWPTGKPYPDTLSQLGLTYPDGGDATILARFEYRSLGTNCTLRTRFGEKETVWSFP